MARATERCGLAWRAMRQRPRGTLVLIASNVAPAFAQNSYGENENVWSIAGRCAREAARLFPDYTPQGNASRENYRRACLRANNIPTPDGPAGASNWPTR